MLRCCCWGLQMTSSDPVLPGTTWQPVSFSSKAMCTVDNLTAGQYYWFRVKAVGPRDNSGFSDVALVMAA